MTAFIFDFDDTLIFSRSDRAIRLLTAIRSFGAHPIEGRLEEMWGASFKDLVLAISPSLKDSYSAFLEFYASELRKTPPVPCPGVLETLPRVRSNASMFVHSASHSLLVRTDLETLGLLSSFDFVCGCDWQRTPKHSVESLDLVLRMIRRAGGSREETIYVGDTAADSTLAIAAGIKFIGVQFGAPAPGAVERQNTSYPVISTMSELLTSVHVLSLHESTRTSG